MGRKTGYNHTEETKGKISKALQGKKLSNSRRMKISNTMKGKKNNLGKHWKINKKYIEKIRKRRRGKNNPNFGKKHPGLNKGKSHHNWIDGRSLCLYPQKFTKMLKEEIRKRDNFLCQKCHMNEGIHKKKFKQVLHIHHIDYNKENCNKNNLITTCKPCNSKANTDRDYWYAYYTYIMEI